jgi:hypothetical protein
VTGGSAFDAAKDAILRDSVENGGLTRQALFDIIVASHDDNRLDHATIGEAHCSLERLVVAEVTQMKRIVAHLESEAGTLGRELKRLAVVIDARGERIKAAQEEVLVEVDARISRALAPRAPRRAGDPLSLSFSETTEEGDMKRAWRIARWAGIVFGAAGIVAIANVVVRLIFGT